MSAEPTPDDQPPPLDHIVSEVAILLNSRFRDDGSNSVAAFMSMTFAGILCVRGIRVVRLSNGHTIVAMPTRRNSRPCPKCQATRINSGTPFCSWCGHLVGEQASESNSARFRDVCYPVDPGCRKAVEVAAFRALDQELAVAAIHGRDYSRAWAVYRGPDLSWRTSPVGAADHDCHDD